MVRKSLFFVVIVFFPIFFLFCVEVLLRFSPWYSTYPLFTEIKEKKEYLQVNPDFGRRYFNNFIPPVDNTPFLKQKSDSSLRIVVVGSETAYGFPYVSSLSFSSQLARHLRLNFPQYRIEVVSVAIPGINSHQYLDMKDDILEINPDFVLVYGGHNEFFGPLGIGSTHAPIFKNRLLNSIGQWFTSLAMTQTVSRIFSSEKSSVSKYALFLEGAVKRDVISEGSEDYMKAIADFEENMEEFSSFFTKQGIPMGISTIGSNVKDQVPLGTSSYAENTYWKAWNALESGDKEAARKLFEQARTSDPLRLRAPSEINHAIKNIAKKSELVYLIDGEQTLRKLSLSEIEDASIFATYAHPNTRGHYVLSRDCFDSVVQALHLQDQRKSDSYSAPLPYALFDKALADIRVAHLTSKYPFQINLDKGKSGIIFQTQISKIQARSKTDSLAVVVYLNDYPVVEHLKTVTQMRLELQDTLSFATHSLSLAHLTHFDSQELKNAISIIRQHRSTELYALEISLLASQFHSDPYFKTVNAELLLKMGEEPSAKVWLER